MRSPRAPLCLLAFGLLSTTAYAAPNKVTTVKDENGWKLQVDGEDTFLFGVNWGYKPIGTNYSYDFWDQDEAFIEQELRKEMALLKGMGVNTIREYDSMPPKWVEWIYDNYGIYTMINPLVGRYGAEIDGVWVPNTNYQDPRTREILTKMTVESVARYKDTRGIIGIMLGNEANYGLSWSSFEIENLPEGEQNAQKARYLYSLYGEIIDEIHKIDPNHPVSICNGDLQYIDIIAEEAGNMDLFGTNVYRGRDAGDLYEVVAAKLDKPIYYAEFGADAYDAKNGREDGDTQATYFRDQWKDVYLNAYGNGGVGNAIGGYSFQWADGWWKYKQEENLDVHDTNASWSNKAYIDDWTPDGNNMNEEWFGIMAKTPPNPDGSFDLQPRPAYFVLRDAFKKHPYEDDTREEIVAHFDALNPGDYAAEVAAFKAWGAVKQQRVELSTLRLDLSMFTTMGTYKPGGGPLNAVVQGEQSVYVGGTVRPVDNMKAEVILNAVGNVADNPIDNIRYENRGNRNLTPDGFDTDLSGLDRVQLYQADFDWSTENVDVDGFYRTGHYHWGFEGDVWGLYPEANYGPNLDTYFGVAPIGVELTGKNNLEGLAFAIGPQLWWGANPAFVARGSRRMLGIDWTLVHHEDLAAANVNATSAAVSEQVIRRTGLAAEYEKRGWNIEVAGLWSGNNKIGQTFTYQIDAGDGESFQDSGKHLVEDRIRLQDTFGGKISISRPLAKTRIFLQGGYQGLVADGGYDTRRNQLGWTLNPSGRGNQWHANAGMFIPVGNFQIGPNVLVNRPLVGPNEPLPDRVDVANGWYYPGVTARNFRDDPFAVLDNRETYGGELLLVYDPTPGSYFFAWDNLDRENARFAASLDIAYRHQPTVRDANFSFTGDGILFAFPGSPPAQDEWQITSRMMINSHGTRIVLSPYVAQQQSRGISERLVTRAGMDFMANKGKMMATGFVRFNDWGPFDFYRDFNFTFPWQTGLDVSTGVGRADFLALSTRLGVRVKFRGLDENSVLANPADLAQAPPPTIGAAGTVLNSIDAGAWEGEILTYLRVMR